MKVTVEIRGIEELKAELARLNAAVATRLAKNGAMAMARVVARHARALAPVGATGDLRRSIKARRGKGPQQRGRVDAYANAAIWYSHFVEYGTLRASPRSFMRAALDTNHAEINQKLLENLSRGIDRELKRQQVPEDPGEA